MSSIEEVFDFSDARLHDSAAQGYGLLYVVYMLAFI